jgi:hypothetical protein
VTAVTVRQHGPAFVGIAVLATLTLSEAGNSWLAFGATLTGLLLVAVIATRLRYRLPHR